MADRLEAYADWLVANQNKRGTPEFDTVANAYKQLRQQPQPKPAAPAPQQRDGAFMYGIDRMQQMVGKGIEVAGDLTGMEGVKQYGTDMVAQQEKDIAAGGYQPQYPGSLRENYEQGTFLPALGEKLLENAPSGGAAIAGTGLTAAAAALGAPAWLVFGGGAAVTAGSGLMGAGEAAMEMEEKTGSYDSKVAAGVGALVGFLDRFGAGKVIPVDRLAGMSAEEVIKELSQKGFGEAAQAYAGRVTKAAAAEGATEVAQETAIVGGAASQGAEYTGQELADRAIDAGVLGSAYGGGTRAVTELAPTAQATREAGAQRLTELGDVLNPVMIGNDPQAATELATRLDTIAKANDLNLKDVNKQSTSGAREAVDKAHIQVSEELKQLAKDLRTQLGITDSDELSVVLDKVMAIAGQRQARNKAKSTVGVQEMQAIDRLAGDTQEGQRMLSLMRQMNELTTLHNSGYVGGVSKITDQLSPIPSNVGYSDRSLIETPTRILGTLYGASVNPVIPAIQGAAVIGGRGIDAVTGRRSRVATYIKDNLGKTDGIKISDDAESVRETRRQEAEGIKKANQEQRARAKEIHKSQYEKNGDLPFLTLDAMLKERGLSPQRAVKLLEAMAAADPVVAPDAQAMIKAIKEGGKVPNMTAIGAAMNTALDQQSTSVTRDKTPVPGAVQAVATAAPRDVSAGYVRGIQDNQAVNTALIEAVDADPTISDDDKAVLIDTLADLRSNLGSNPADRAMDIAAKAENQVSDPALVEAYVMPYVNRVIGQQTADSEPTINMFTSMRFPNEEAPKRTHREIGEVLMAEQTNRYGRDLNPYDDMGDFNTVADEMTKEAQLQMDKMPDAETWYDDDVKLALETTAKEIPQINDSGENKQLFLLLAALTSVGHKPRINWRYAGALAMHYFNTGEIGEIGLKYSEKRKTNEERLLNPATGELFGLKAASIEPGLKILRHMLNTYGVKGTFDFIDNEKTKAEIDAMRAEAGFGPQSKIKGGKNAIVPGIQMFGPKVGPFYMNLNGIKEVTVDLWASRTVRRHTGGLLSPNFDPNNKKAAESGLVDAPTEVERPTMKMLYTKVGENLGITPQAAQAVLWAYEQELYNDLGAKLIYEKFSEGADLFREKEALAYAERYPSAAARQEGNRGQDPSTAEPTIDYQRRIGDGVASSPAEPGEIRDQLAVTEQLFAEGKPIPIGLPGSPFENGIQDLRVVEKLAKALGYAFEIYANPNRMNKDLKERFNSKGLGKDFTGGFLTTGGNKPTSKLFDQITGRSIRGKIGVLDVYKNPRGDKVVTLAESIWAALHELGHGIERSAFITDNTPSPAPITFNNQDGALRLAVDDKYGTPQVYTETFRDFLMQIMQASSGKPGEQRRGRSQINISKEDAQQVINEMIDMQRTGVLSISGVGDAVARSDYPRIIQIVMGIRNDSKLTERQKAQKEEELRQDVLKAEAQYYHSMPELAADMIGMYMTDPKGFKQRAPAAAAITRQLLNQINSPTSGLVKFYSMPLATVVAIIMANLLAGEREEQEEQGMLNLGRGLLTA